jgi:hypothetical protein
MRAQLGKPPAIFGFVPRCNWPGYCIHRKLQCVAAPPRREPRTTKRAQSYIFYGVRVLTPRRAISMGTRGDRDDP